MRRRMVGVAVLAAVMLVSVAAADVYQWELKTDAGGVQEVINGVHVRGEYGGSNRSWPGTLTCNENTGTIYLTVARGNTSYDNIRTFDPAVTSPVTAPVEAQSGVIGTNNAGDSPAQEYLGSRQSGPQDQRVGDDAIGFNPNYTRGTGYTGSVMQRNRQYSAGQYFWEWAPQSPARNWGELEEGTVASNLLDGARFSENNVGGHSWSGGSKGLAYLDQEDDGGPVDRWANFYDRGGTNSNEGLRIYQMGTAVTGATNTTAGSRTTSNKGLLFPKYSATDLDFIDLVPNAGDAVRDIAVRHTEGAATNVFDIYFLSYDGTNGLTYLSAIQATVPVDPAGWAVEQLDVSGSEADGIDYLQLRDTVADADIAGRGITFSPDGSLLYVSSSLQLSTGNSAYDDARIYIFELIEDKPIPEPASAGLVLIGLAGLLRRRRS